MPSAVLSLVFFLALAAPTALSADASTAPAAGLPLFMADLHNPNDFSLFANGGWDGSWYVGFNTCWMQKLPAPPDGRYVRAYLGAKLGRMKNFQVPGRAPWERRPYAGDVYMAIASTPSWSRGQSYFLTGTEDIPLEPENEVAFEGVGESRWFWTEIPLKLVNLKGDNYLALWSPSERLTSVSSSPILAAGWGGKEVDSWVSHEIKGIPPKDPAKALSTPVTVFEPAIALKLVPELQGPEPKPTVRIARVADGKPRGKAPAPKMICAAVTGDSVERAWVEISTDSRKWAKFGPPAWNAPYCFSLKMEQVPVGNEGKTWARVGAANVWENVGTSEGVNLFEPSKP